MTNLRQMVRTAIRATAIKLVALLFVCGAVWPVMSPQNVNALPLPDRSLNIADASPSALTAHTFTFSYGSPADPVGSVLFEYCTSPLPQLPCVGPTGLDTSAAALAQQTGETGYAILSTNSNQIVLSRPPAAPATGPSSYAFGNIVNPGAPTTFYARISTYSSLDATGSQIDFGAVVNATTQGVHIASEVPPILKFCVGLNLGDDCTAADDSVVDLGELSAGKVSYGSSQMIAATNAELGLAIAVYGTTMTSGNNIIPALTTPTPSAPGNAQFGLNLRNNSDPDVGQDPSGVGSTSPTSPYNIPNRYAFTGGDSIATSPFATDTRKFTASYVVNVPPSQAPGVYTATLTYICTATF